MIKLSVNLNKVALLRNQRDIGYPRVLDAAKTVLDAGADGVTVHPRPDERHIRRDDVFALAPFVRDYARDYARNVEFNVEGYPSEDFLDLIGQTRPHQVTLVPDLPDTRTSDTGWDVRKHGAMLTPIIARLHEMGCRVSLFMEADPRLASSAAATGADRVELYTGPYAFAHQRGDMALLHQASAAASAFTGAGLALNAGHDLNLDNLPDFCAAVPELREVSIGHAFTADALWAGLTATVKKYKQALK